MKHLYCTIAVGQKYVESAINMVKKLNTISNNHHFLIATDLDIDLIENLTVIKVPDDDEVLFINNVFNFCLKYYPLLHAKNMDYDNIIYVDADWKILDTYDENKIIELFDFMDSNQLDMLFERPHTIGHGKYDGVNCFWYHKIDFYKLLETDEYDDGEVCNEQFMVFKNSEKFGIFIKKWEELCNHATSSRIWPFAEGLEIGMSMSHAKLKTSYYWNYIMRNMYEFKSVNGGINIRF